MNVTHPKYAPFVYPTCKVCVHCVCICVCLVRVCVCAGFVYGVWACACVCDCACVNVCVLWLCVCAWVLNRIKKMLEKLSSSGSNWREKWTKNILDWDPSLGSNLKCHLFLSLHCYYLTGCYSSSLIFCSLIYLQALKRMIRMNSLFLCCKHYRDFSISGSYWNLNIDVLLEILSFFIITVFCHWEMYGPSKSFPQCSLFLSSISLGTDNMFSHCKNTSMAIYNSPSSWSYWVFIGRFLDKYLWIYLLSLL